MAVPQETFLAGHIFTDGVPLPVFRDLWDGTGENDGCGRAALSLLSDPGTAGHDHHAQQLYVRIHPYQRDAAP